MPYFGVLNRPLLPLIVFLLASTGCREALPVLGDTSQDARLAADEMLRVLASRFGPTDLSPELAELRPKLARHALTPSRIFNDSAVWTSMRDSARTLEIAGSAENGRYLLSAQLGAKLPGRPGDARHVMHLRRLRESEHEWRSRDELAIGRVSVGDLDRALTQIFLAAAAEDPERLRASYRAHFPRATEALGRLFVLDTIAVAPAAGGATLVTFAVSLHPDRTAASFPHYARYVRKYFLPVRYRVSMSDKLGASWAIARKTDERLTLGFQVRDGSLAPPDGSSRRIPDSLRVSIDFSAKVLVFRVGMSGLESDVALRRLPNEKGFAMRFTREPDWRFPPLVEQMLRAPLRRPFQDEGATLGFAVRDSLGAQTLATRDIAIAVRESAVVRWLGGLGHTALSDFRQGAEREAERFYGEALDALREDVLRIMDSRAAHTR